MAKGIRVNQLAKELGVASKSILDKLRDEGLGDKAPNHMSVLPLGLAESVREWFASSSGDTAVESGAHVAVAEKPKTTVRRRKKIEGEEEPPESSTTTVEAPPVVEEPPVKPIRKAPAPQSPSAAPIAEPPAP
ncbi:MAG TPA: translation initiation factor IF-2 N-terminal domain-containing protein, partial [Tepidisphaeraceae bacterium]|nr:translation initiation factor IF-2 N-terminal domain-containing protein [Tepidisphaeraceae bacterium]